MYVQINNDKKIFEVNSVAIYRYLVTNKRILHMIHYLVKSTILIKVKGQDTLSSEIITHGLCQGTPATARMFRRTRSEVQSAQTKVGWAGGSISKLDGQMERQKAMTFPWLYHHTDFSIRTPLISFPSSTDDLFSPL